MADVYATIVDQDPAVQSRVATILELRAAEAEQKAMLEAYLSKIPFQSNATVLEVGCGTGAISRQIVGRSGVGQVVGIDPCALFIERARELAGNLPNLIYQEGDGQALPFPDASFDVVVFHTVLCHLPQPTRALSEARRVLRPGGSLAIFDGDYATTTLARFENDPLQCCADAATETLVHNRWLIRSLPSLVVGAGFEVKNFSSHGYIQTNHPDYMLTLADRGADALVASGCIGRELAAALKEEARRRVGAGTFFGHIAYASMIARA